MEQNSPKRLLQKKTLKNQNKPRKKLQNKSFLWDFGYGISWNLKIWQYSVESLKRGEKGEKCCKLVSVGQFWVCESENCQEDTRWWWLIWVLTPWNLQKGKQQDDGTNSWMMAGTGWWQELDDGRKRVKTAKTGVFFAFGENFKMLNVVICVLRHFLGDW